ncbi:MAG: hypothetical protein O2857_12110 [Planctomycetota bacterium]|nr:hypothetical protein [Planctomycetota bacterium]
MRDQRSQGRKPSTKELLGWLDDLDMDDASDAPHPPQVRTRKTNTVKQD